MSSLFVSIEEGSFFFKKVVFDLEPTNLFIQLGLEHFALFIRFMGTTVVTSG